MGRSRNAMRLERASQSEWKENSFDDFITQLLAGNVVLMVGRNIELNRDALDDNGQPMYVGGDGTSRLNDYYQHILYALNEAYGTQARDFTDLSYDERFSYSGQNEMFSGRIQRVDIHAEIRRAIQLFSPDISDVSQQLKDLINTGLFRFVLTTTFDPLVEIAMREKWKGNLRIMSFMDADMHNRDISGAEDMERPTLYYLFGSASQGEQRFVATDNDALHFLKLWQKKSSMSELLRQVSKKYLFTIGCDYDDWLFRFIWYTFRDAGESELSKGCVSDFTLAPSLEKYLMQNNVYIERNSESLLDKILKRVRNVNPVETEPRKYSDVFISYSRRDSKYVESIYDALTSQGLTVWYDKYELGGHGAAFMEKIYSAIRTCRVFIPIISSSIAEEFGELHPYRQEWNTAYEVQIQKGINYDYCIPVNVAPFDLKQASLNGVVDSWISSRDAFNYNPDKKDELEQWSKSLATNLISRKR